MPRTTPPAAVPHLSVSYDPGSDNNGIRTYFIQAQNYTAEEDATYTLVQLFNGAVIPHGTLEPSQQRTLFLEVDSTFRIDATAPTQVVTVETLPVTTPGNTI